MTTASPKGAERTQVHQLRTIGAEHTAPRVLPGSLLASRGELVRATSWLIAMLIGKGHPVRPVYPRCWANRPMLIRNPAESE